MSKNVVSRVPISLFLTLMLSNFPECYLRNILVKVIAICGEKYRSYLLFGV